MISGAYPDGGIIFVTLQVLHPALADRQHRIGGIAGMKAQAEAHIGFALPVEKGAP